ncbi:MAG: insulinase family protein [Alphaproteobacteria bacterium]|nr:insulinase family protein [Alphaproteobacteria bacterium]
MKYKFALIMFFTAFLAVNSAFAGVFNPEYFKLDNGMEVYVIRNHRSPVVTNMLWYKVGSIDEPSGAYGVAHFLEHLMFKSKDHIPSGEFSKRVSKVGGNDNAFTFYEYTAYHQTVSVNNLSMVMQMEADRMRSIDVSKKDFEMERKVILEERLRRTEGKPFVQLRDRVGALMWYGTPYAVPVIGFEQSIKDIKYSDIVKFHKDWYAPNNTVLIVAGDITAENLKPLAEKYYGSIPARKLPARKNIKPVMLDCDANVVLHHENIQQPKVIKSFPAASFNMPYSVNSKEEQLKEIYATKVLSEIIGSDSTSLLFRNMVIKDKKAISINSVYRAASKGDGTFMLYGVPAEGVSVKAFEASLDDEIASILDGGISEEDVKQAKQRLVAGLIYAVDNPEDAAHALGTLLVIGRDVKEIENWVDNVGRITLADVKAAAARLFDSDRAVVTGWVLPKENTIAEGDSVSDGSSSH